MKKFLCVLVVLSSIFCSSIYAADTHSKTEETEEAFDPTELIMHHIADSHAWHVVSWGEGENEKHIEIPLPIILINEGKFHFFLYSKFDHDTHIAENNGSYFFYHHGTIYNTDEHGTVEYDDHHHVINSKPWDFSLTRNVWSMWLSIGILIWIFISVAKAYKAGPAAPKGIQSLFEPIIVFVKEEIVDTQIHGDKAAKFAPYLLTVFFFIWINNLIGLVPFFPGASNLTGNIAVTMVLASITFLITNFNGTKSYWGHIFWMPGVPVPIRLLLSIIEFIGLFTKPFALMVRLFANITAGHIIILSLVSLIFILQSVFISPVSILLTLIMFTLELLVAVLQAYIFTLLSALFIGMAVEDHAH